MGTRTAVLERVFEDMFEFSSMGRRYRVPLDAELKPRNPAARPRAIIGLAAEDQEDARVAFADGGRKPRLSSIAVDYDLTAYLVDGEALTTPRPERPTAEREAPPGPAEDGVAVAIERVDEVFGWPVLVARRDGAEVPLVSHRDLAVRLGYAHAHDVLEIAKSALGDGWRFLAPRQVTSSGVEGGRPSVTWLFDRRQALEITVMARTESASRVRKLVLDVFEAWLAGRTMHGPAAPPAGDPCVASTAPLDVQALLAAVTESVTRIMEPFLTALVAPRHAPPQLPPANSAETVLAATPAGSATETPDGAWSSKRPEGYKSQRGLASDFALPQSGVGATFVARVATALGIPDDPDAVSYQDVVIGGRVRGQHMVYGPRAIEKLAPALRFASSKMLESGYRVIRGVMQPCRANVRSKEFVLQEMLAAATAGADGIRPAPAAQQTIPEVDGQRAS